MLFRSGDEPVQTAPQRRSFEERARWTTELFERLQQAEVAKKPNLHAQARAYANSHGHRLPADALDKQQ